MHKYLPPSEFSAIGFPLYMEGACYDPFGEDINSPYELTVSHPLRRCWPTHKLNFLRVSAPTLRHSDTPTRYCQRMLDVGAWNFRSRFQ